MFSENDDGITLKFMKDTCYYHARVMYPNLELRVRLCLSQVPADLAPGDYVLGFRYDWLV